MSHHPKIALKHSVIQISRSQWSSSLLDHTFKCMLNYDFIIYSETMTDVSTVLVSKVPSLSSPSLL